MRPSSSVGSALDHRPIGLADPALLEQPAELGERLAVAAEHQAAGGVAVEPVRERGRARQAEAQRVEMILQALAALRPPVHREPGRLVDHQHQPVAVEQARHHLFRCHLDHRCVMPAQRHPALIWEELDCPLSRAMTTERQSRYHGPRMNDSTEQTKLVAAAERRPQAHVDRSQHVDLRPGQARAALARAHRRDRGGADPRRSRRRCRRPDRDRDGGRPLRQVSARCKACSPPRSRRCWRRSRSRSRSRPAKPFVILVVGVNGSGKTTTIGKLAARFRARAAR